MAKDSKRRYQSLEQLEDGPWPQPSFDSYLTGEIQRLRSVPIRQLRVEDLRLLIGQSLGLRFLVPLALEHLVAHPLAAGDFYPGDLLKNVTGVDESFWDDHPELRRQLVGVLEGALPRIDKARTSDELRAELTLGLTRHRSKLKPAI
jgi:hypothetical protein